MRFSAKLLIWLFLLLLSRPGYAQTQPEAQPASAYNSNIATVVITWDAPIINGINRSSEMFEQFSRIINSDKNATAKTAQQTGAIWSLNTNLSGTQLAIFHADNANLAVSLAEKALNGFSEIDFNNLGHKTNHDFFRFLPGFCSRLAKSPGHQPITIFTAGIDEESSNRLASLTIPLIETFPLQIPQNFPERPVLRDLPPTLFEVISWNDNSESAFFSAKFAGEKFAEYFSQEETASYEIVYGTDGLKLVLAIAGSEDRLFKSLAQLKHLVNQINREPDGNSWPVFAKAASAIVADDHRDMTKSILFKAWLNHWQPEKAVFHNKLSYLLPSDSCSFICLPEPWMHDFSFSENSFPVFSAARASTNSSQADISMAFTSENPAILTEVENTLSELVSVEFPLSKAKPASETLLLSFHCNVNEISAFVAIIRARILDHLLKKDLISNIENSLKISLAATGNFPPLQLRGMLKEGWPPQAIDFKWKAPALNDISRLMQVSSDDPSLIMKRWQLFVATGKGKSQALAMSATRHLRLKSFSEPLQ